MDKASPEVDEKRYDAGRFPRNLPVGRPLNTREQLDNLIQWIEAIGERCANGDAAMVLHGWSMALSVIHRQSYGHYTKTNRLVSGVQPTQRFLRDLVTSLSGSIRIWTASRGGQG